VRHLEDFQFIVNVFREKKVRYTINTDGTYLCSTTLRREFSLLREAGVLTDDEAETARQLAFDVSFI
jgi:adenosine deaminase